MAQNECIPFYDDGDHITGYCTAAVSGKRFVKVSATRSGGTFDAAAAIAADRGAVHIAHADVGGRVHGVAAYDGAVGSFIDVIRGAKMVVPVLAGGALSAFGEVGVGLNGVAIPAGAEASVAATHVTGTVGAKNAILWTAKGAGTVGNDITIALVAASGDNVAGSVVVTNEDIVVYVDTTAVTGTKAADVIAAVTASADASALVTAGNSSTSDGTGVVAAVSKTALTGGAEGGTADQAVGYVLADCVAGHDAQVSLY